MAISNLVLTRQIYSEETIGAHAHNRERVPLWRVYGYHINFNLKVYKLTTNNLCTNVWSSTFSYLFNGQTKERKECINV